MTCHVRVSLVSIFFYGLNLACASPRIFVRETITDITVKVCYLIKEYSTFKYYTITCRAAIDVSFVQCLCRRWYFLAQCRRQNSARSQLGLLLGNPGKQLHFFINDRAKANISSLISEKKQVNYIDFVFIK